MSGARRVLEVRGGLERLHRLIDAVTLHHPVFGKLSAEWMPVGPSLELVITAQVPDRNERPASAESVTEQAGVRVWDPGTKPKTIPVKLTVSIAVDDVLGFPTDDGARRYLAGQLRLALLAAAEHEIDEMIVVRGDRIFDPHAQDEDRKLRSLGA